MNKIKLKKNKQAHTTDHDICGCGRKTRYVIMIDGKKEYSCNKYGRCPSYEDLSNKITELTYALKKYRKAMELTRQYVGYKTLPEIDGWSWYDADKYAKEVLGIEEKSSQNLNRIQ